MGEKLKNLSKGKIHSIEFEIELNHPTVSGRDQIIHIQSDQFRFEMNKKDFLKYALSVMVAERNLKIIKGIK